MKIKKLNYENFMVKLRYLKVEESAHAPKENATIIVLFMGVLAYILVLHEVDLNEFLMHSSPTKLKVQMFYFGLKALLIN